MDGGLDHVEATVGSDGQEEPQPAPRKAKSPSLGAERPHLSLETLQH